jgi:DNA-directed RNA polymerase subunit M/transcription elongation factor TFIIS
MALYSATVVSAPRSFGMRSCPHCSELVVAPEASEFVSDGEVRHIWSCDSCGNEFETAVRMEPPRRW